jgi:hypothetical protein
MNRRTVGLTTVFALLLFVTAGGILYHYISGYDYPASPAFWYELNVLGDLYEAFITVPVGLLALWLLRKHSPWGPLLIAGVAANLTYNYAMVITGQQNLWIFFWTVKLALAGTAVCLVWEHLPAGTGRPARPRVAVGGYLLLVLLIFGKMMGQRLLASATGTTVSMTMEAGAAAVDWAEPMLRDPVIFFALATPVIIAGILGLWRGTDWGARAASLSSVFLVTIVSLILFTGPLKEYLQTGSVSPALWGISAMMTLAAVPAVLALVWLAKGERSRPEHRAAA